MHMTEAFLEHANGEHVGELITLSRDEILIGRLSDCDIRTEPVFTSVSQHHAILRRTAKGWVIIDVGTYGKGSSYGTYINDIRLVPNEPGVLQPGDEIRLGTKLGKYFRFLGQGTVPVQEPIRLGRRLSVDADIRQVLFDGRALSLHLAPQEFEFLWMLWQRSGKVCTLKEICVRIWPDEKSLAAKSVDADLRVRINTLAYSLRRKLKPALEGIDPIESYHGVGYRLRF